jgi:radical SAM protein with 4Fe4S-binding SPASM domain
MIGCTKLLCGTATVAEALHHERSSEKLPPHLLQFSSDLRPLVVWNVTNRCNLSCKHCYISAEDRQYADELTTAEARAFIEDLAAMRCPVLLFSGGEPVARRDIYELAQLASSLGVRPVLSTNGTLITPEVARDLKDAGFQYVGVSIDGLEVIHDDFRGQEGAFRGAIQGVLNAAEAGLRTGARMTVNALNIGDLPGVIRYAVEVGIPRLCIYHLVYAGRGTEIAALDTTLEQKREMMQFIVEETKRLHREGANIEILTVDNHADGVYLLDHIRRHDPERLEEVTRLLQMHGGCSAGTKMSNVDPTGNVHACQFWGHRTLGNVRERKFSEIWRGEGDEFLSALRDKPAHLKGKCGRCSYNALCAGCRIRAEVVTGDIWEADPACYLTEDEIAASQP